VFYVYLSELKKYLDMEFTLSITIYSINKISGAAVFKKPRQPLVEGFVRSKGWS
jgi:hypothetical protein